MDPISILQQDLSHQSVSDFYTYQYPQRINLSQQVPREIDEILDKMYKLAFEDPKQRTEKSVHSGRAPINDAMFQFDLHPSTGIVFYDQFTLRKLYSGLINSFCLIRNAQKVENYQLYIKIKGQIEQRTLSRLCKELIRGMCGNRTIMPRFKRSISSSNESIASILREIADNKKQNFILFVVSDDDMQVDQLEHMKKLNLLKIRNETVQKYEEQMTNMCLAPHGYNNLLSHMQTMTKEELHHLLKYKDLESIYENVRNQALDGAISQLIREKFENGSVGTKEVELYRMVLNDQCFRFHVLKECHQSLYKLFLQSAIGKDNYVLTHPSFFYSLQKQVSQLNRYGVLDVSVYQPDFLMPLLLAARAFARIFLRQREKISSDEAVIMLAGAAGAGKSILTDMFHRFCGGYKWVTDTTFQNTSLLVSSTIVMEEVKLEQLKESRYKQLTDFQSAVKVDFKNKQPVDATKHCPIVMNTNEDCFRFFEDGMRTRTQEQHVEAVRRRLQIIPFFEKFSDIHKPFKLENEDDSKYVKHYQEFIDMEAMVPQLFNFFIGFGLHQIWLTNVEVNESLKYYMEHCALGFTRTVFGYLYMRHRATIDILVKHVEDIIHQKKINRDIVIKIMKQNQYELSEMIDSMYYELTINRSHLNQEWKFPSSYDQYYMKRLIISKDVHVMNQLKELQTTKYVHPDWQEIIDDSYPGYHSPTDSDDNESIHNIVNELDYSSQPLFDRVNQFEMETPPPLYELFGIQLEPIEEVKSNKSQQS